jgi:hypothetical protein
MTRDNARQPPGLPPKFFQRTDPQPDEVFYTEPRVVTHIDIADATI